MLYLHNIVEQPIIKDEKYVVYLYLYICYLNNIIIDSMHVWSGSYIAV